MRLVAATTVFARSTVTAYDRVVCVKLEMLCHLFDQLIGSIDQHSFHSTALEWVKAVPVFWQIMSV